MKSIERLGRLPLLVLGLVAMAFAAWAVAGWVTDLTVGQLRATATARLTLYESTLRAAINRYHYLPFVLSRNVEVHKVLTQGGDESALNAYMEALNRKSGAAALYLMDVNGDTLAASNWRTPDSFVGNNYSFRPYFQDALAGESGFFFGIGVTTGLPGLFLSHPVLRGRDVVGVAVVKVDLEPLQRNWQQGGEVVFATDPEEVIILSSREDWRYQTLTPLVLPTIKRIAVERRYRGASLDPLPIKRRHAGADTFFDIGGQEYLVEERPVRGTDWRLHFLSPTTLVDERRVTAVIIVGISVGLILLGTLFARERRLKLSSQREAAEAERFRQLNRRLEEEVEERKRAESVLRETQDELVQSGKLAALGQMSAAIAHELNQPISAIRTFAASARLMVERGVTERLEETLDQISNMTERMGVITGQLKTFSRKSQGRLENIDLRECLRNALVLVEPQLRMDKCVLESTVPDQPVMVHADAVRVEQVLVNLIRNGLDAMKGQSEPHIGCEIERRDGWSVTKVFDRGSGIDDEIAGQLFDPFFTTKEPGKGVGLGLSVSYGIVRDLNGMIKAHNRSEGGAVFEVWLPVQEKEIR